MNDYTTAEVRFVRDNPHMSIAAIADTLGRNYSSVWGLIQRQGIKRRMRPYREWTTKEVKRIIELREQGYTYRQIGEILGRSGQNCRGAHQRAVK